MALECDIKTINGGIAVDDRGSLRFINDFDPMTCGVRRFYQVENHRRGFIRAYHGHVKEAKYVYVVSGSALIAVAPLFKTCDVYQKTEVKKFVLSAAQPKVLYIPPSYFNGFMNLEENTKVLFFSTSTLEESKGDDVRLPYDYWNVWQEDFR